MKVPADLPPLGPEMGRQLLLIAQEAARNGLRHAAHRRIGLTLGTSPDGITLRVWNDGAPWEEPRDAHAGLGLRIMRYRAGVLGGSLVVPRPTQGGTEVVCVVPKGKGLVSES